MSIRTDYPPTGATAYGTFELPIATYERMVRELNAMRKRGVTEQCPCDHCQPTSKPDGAKFTAWLGCGHWDRVWTVESFEEASERLYVDLEANVGCCVCGYGGAVRVVEESFFGEVDGRGQ